MQNNRILFTIRLESIGFRKSLPQSIYFRLDPRFFSFTKNFENAMIVAMGKKLYDHWGT